MLGSKYGARLTGGPLYLGAEPHETLHSGELQCLNMPEAVVDTLWHLIQHILSYAETAEATGDKAVKVGLQFFLVYVGKIVIFYYCPSNHCAPALRVPAHTILINVSQGMLSAELTWCLM